VADRYALRFVQNLSLAAAMEKWQPVVDVALAFSGQLQAATDQGLKAEERVATAHSDFGAMIEATRTFNAETFDSLRRAPSRQLLTGRRRLREGGSITPKRLSGGPLCHSSPVSATVAGSLGSAC
jgi:hypothetical protein